MALALIKAEGLDANGRARVLREAQAMGRLGANPNIVAVFDLGEEDGQPYFVSELMAGGDLERLLDQAPKRQLPIPMVLDLAIGITRGLAFAHARASSTAISSRQRLAQRGRHAQDRRLRPGPRDESARASPRKG